MARNPKGVKGIAKRWVENPHRDDVLIEERLSDLKIKREELPSMIEADVRLTSLIGGLSRVKGRTEAQTLAAARYRGLWERSQIGGAKATDYTQLRVDTSGAQVGAELERGEQARREYSWAVQQLGMVQSRLVERVVCEDGSLRDLARVLDEGQGGAAIERVRKRVLVGVDILAQLFGYAPAAPRRRIRIDGERPTDASAAGSAFARKACTAA